MSGYDSQTLATIFEVYGMRNLKAMLWPAMALILLLGCQKDLTDETQDTQPPGSPEAGSPAVRLRYADSLFYKNNAAGDYLILPISRPGAAGYIKSIPAGLIIDSTTGRINISQSESGLLYKIFYVTNAGQVIDSTKLTISGIDYRDAIVEISATPIAYDTVFPVYNARVGNVLPCGDDDEDNDGDIDDDDNGCVFDETDLNGDGNDDIAGAIQDKLLVDIKKGSIDIEASFRAGIFGSSDPANGLSKDFTINYRLQDASNKALNQITVRVYHFKKRSDIPQALLDTINGRADLLNTVQTGRMINQTGPGPSFSGSTGSTSARVQFTDRFTINELAAKPKRPPVIIIVSQ